MEVKIDKRTKEYKMQQESLEQPSPLEVVEDTTIDGTTQIPVTFSGTIPISPANSFSIKPKPDLLHCPGCGAELLEDERNGKSVAYCRACIWRNA